ncbi:hypothetical protein [Methylocystis parvus]|uniref:UrcA family protein n=1 Tax=Methylocystis parvus TaxID=134 RepID=A0A6B8M2J9_9HYPH|nr:hypothetical protein [Methylocystis parvus]QGM99087.1 hypothetical protein F7D14_17410 [Methylocystis parvus]WBK00544.1 hypothetical protein MMG94_02130 [Methylocystis parvus OBBP]
MNRNDANRRKFASRPLRAAVAVKIAFAIMAANVSFAAAKAVFHKTDANVPAVAASVSTVKPFILPVMDKAEAAPEAVAQRIEVAALQGCREIVTQTDEGYGVRGSVTRTVCRKAL